MDLLCAHGVAGTPHGEVHDKHDIYRRWHERWKRLEIHPSGRNEGPMVVGMDESSKSSLYDDGEKRKEQVGDDLVANEEAIEIPTEHNGRIKRFRNDGRYF